MSILLAACVIPPTNDAPNAQAMELEGENRAVYVPIEKTVVKMPIADDVSLDEAIESMKLRANELNI